MAQRDPLNEYKSEALELFRGLMGHWDEKVTAQLMRVEVSSSRRAAGTAADGNVASRPGASRRATSAEATALEDLNARLADIDFAAATAPAPQAKRDPADPATWGKIGRNEPCPCGSGKKYKHCHGKLGEA